RSGADQFAVADKAVIDALVNRQLAWHPGRLKLGGEVVAVVEQRIEAADDQMCLRDALEIGEDRGGAPILLLLRALKIGLPDPAHVGLVEPGSLAETLPGRAVAVGRVDA